MKKIIYLSLLTIFVILLNSCSYWKQRYVKDISMKSTDTMSIAVPPDYKIKSNDILSVKIFSYSKDVNDLFNSFQNNGSGVSASQIYSLEANAYYNGYIVNDSGYIKLPVIGDILIKDKTIDEVRKIVGEKLNTYVQDAIVFAKLSLFKITILGEVNSPGMKYIYSNRLTLLEAMALSGDVRDMGDKRNVLIVRTTDKGIVTYRIDLTDSKLLSSTNFYILPNDVIYVEPRKAKALQLDWAIISIIVSMITTVTLLVNIVKK